MQRLAGTLRAETFGTAAHPRCHLKGGETNTFLEFLVTCTLPVRADALGALRGPVRRAGQDLFRILQLIREGGDAFSLPAIQEFYERGRSYLQTMHELGVTPKPKDHMLMHLAERIRVQGGPSVYGNWLDESINKTLKDVAAAAHGSVTYTRTLNEFPLALAAQPTFKRARSSRD